jgi:hypothetical protein
MRKTLILAAGLAALAAPAAALDVKIQNATPGVLTITMTDSKCVLPRAYGPVMLPSGQTAQVLVEVLSDSSCAVYHSRLTLRLDLAAPGGFTDTVSVGVQKPFSAFSDLEVPRQTTGPHGMIVQGSSDQVTATLEVACPTCKPE